MKMIFTDKKGFFFQFIDQDVIVFCFLLIICLICGNLVRYILPWLSGVEKKHRMFKVIVMSWWLEFLYKPPSRWQLK